MPEFYTSYLVTSSLPLYDVGIIAPYFLQMRKTRPERLSNLPRVTQPWGQHSNPGSLTSGLMFLATMLEKLEYYR